MSNTIVGRRVGQVGRALASPLGVLITLPLLVVAIGVTILLVGRSTSTTSSQAMARRQLVEQAAEVQGQVVFALDQAEPLLERLRQFADPTVPRDDVLLRLHDLIVGRPGVAYASVSFPDGTFRGAYLAEGGAVQVQESRITDGATAVARFDVVGGRLEPRPPETSTYDPRTRSFYKLATERRARGWTEPYSFFRSHETGISCAEPVLDAAGGIAAVIAVDFDVSTLSRYVGKPALEGARSIVYSRDGAILVYPPSEGGAPRPPPTSELLHAADLRDPALEALLERTAHRPPIAQLFFTLETTDGDYLASVAPIGGRRAGVDAALDWYVASVVPARTILGPTRALQRSGVLISAVALLVAIALAVLLAWNLLRMRRQVVASRAQARSAEARARELGSYRLVGRLGEGGMGEVWRAEHQLLAREAAIKLIRSDNLTDPVKANEHRERFRREAQTLASMKSRHTIDIFDYGVTDDGVFYFVMELLDGLDLETLVIEHGPQPAARVIDLLVQACASLAEAHDAGLLHRDIKPPNLFVCRAADEVDIVKLLDFGIVHLVDDPDPPPAPALSASRSGLPRAATPVPSLEGKLTEIDAMIGTPGFMAPEQITGGALDGRADLYALGCVAWWLLTGAEVFPRFGGPLVMLQMHLEDPPPSLREQVPGWCPPELEAIVVACLQKKPPGRPMDARNLIALLRAIEIPAEHAWTPAKARQWWDALRPRGPRETQPDEVKVLLAEGIHAQPGLGAAEGDPPVSLFGPTGAL
ncbi:MAG: protein kinase [Kofleriaceae bacterium]